MVDEKKKSGGGWGGSRRLLISLFRQPKLFISPMKSRNNICALNSYLKQSPQNAEVCQ